MVTLLGSEQVWKELKVTDDQKGKIEGIVADIVEQWQPPDPREGDFGAEFKKKRQQFHVKLENLDKKLDALLSKEQVKRLNEILLQQKGTEGLIEAPVVAALKLSEEQIGKIKVVFRTQDDERRKLFDAALGGDGGRGGFGEIREKTEKIPEKMEKIREKMGKIDKNTETNALAVLTTDQKEHFAALKGAAFELDRRSLRSPFRPQFDRRRPLGWSQSNSISRRRSEYSLNELR